jgi:hypothetical protein
MCHGLVNGSGRDIENLEYIDRMGRFNVNY